MKISKLALAALVLCAIFMFASCSDNRSDSTDASSSYAATEATDGHASETEYLTFIDGGEIYFDVNLSDIIIDDLSIKIDGVEIGFSNAEKFSKNSDVAAAGTPSADIYVYVFGESVEATADSINGRVASVRAKNFVEVLPSYIRSYGSDKTYVVITDDKNGWDHSLSENLNLYVERLVDTAFGK